MCVELSRNTRVGVPSLDAGTAKADAERFVAPELVGRLQEDLAVALERHVALTTTHVAFDLHALHRGELLLTTDRLARLGEQHRPLRRIFRLRSNGREMTGEDDDCTHEEHRRATRHDHEPQIIPARFRARR